MDEKYPQRVSSHTNSHTQLCGKPTCLPGKPWSPEGLDSLRKHTIPLTVWAVCLESTSRGRGGRSSPGRTVLALFHWEDSPEASPTVCSSASHLNLRLKQREAEEQSKTPLKPLFAVCLSSRSSRVPAVQSAAPNRGERDVCLPIKAESRPVKLSVALSTRRED